ncbi:MAG: RNA polymerase sigma factor [Lachnospiraceae bacterium]|nr:RNA polymerase sigma factor [Lachnospiraceae bacterium]
MIAAQRPIAVKNFAGDFLSICRPQADMTPNTLFQTDQEKFSELYETYFHSLWYVALGYLKDTQLAEDMVQETFIKVSEHLTDIQDVHSKMTKYFLITITRNKCIDYMRKKNRTPETLMESQEYPPESDNLPLEHVIHQETLDELTCMINSLEDSYRIPLKLRYIQGLSNLEIADTTGLSVNLVAVRINRAKKMLKKRLNMAYF